MYVHATCATDTNNIAFVMESVFDIILKENLRKLAVGDVDSMLELASGSGVSGVKTGAGIWDADKQGKILLAACYYTESTSRSVRSSLACPARSYRPYRSAPASLSQRMIGVGSWALVRICQRCPSSLPRRAPLRVTSRRRRRS